MAIENVILVDEYDHALGSMEKMQVHIEGLLHRAFSVFIFNSDNQLLLQKRNVKKYHSGGLWTNTCCGHPRPDENVQSAAFRRLGEEMGFTCELFKQFDFIYEADFENGLTEHEFDHVFTGAYEDFPKPDPEEVEDWKYVDWDWLLKDVVENPENYTFWFRICLEKFIEKSLVSINTERFL